MKQLVQFLKEEVKEKIDRSAFLYMNPQDPKATFGQCGTCMMWTGKTCTIHGPSIPIKAQHSCGLYVHGDPVPEQLGHEMASVTPEESGLVLRKVRCENCVFANPSATECGLYKKLNTVYPSAFDLDTKIDPQGCCNAQTEK